MIRRWRSSMAAVLTFGLAAALHGALRLATPPDALPRPLLAATPWMLAGLGLLAAIASCVVWARRMPRPRHAVAVVVAHLLGSIALAVGVLVSDPSFPFGPTLAASLELPGDRGHAYLYRGGVLCSQEIHIAAPGQWYSVQRPDLGAFTCDREGALRWDGERGQPQAIDATGAPLPSTGWERAFGEGLDWRPH